jgi:putative endonuclease
MRRRPRAPDRELRRKHQRRGLAGEWLAALWLCAKGYRILARRLKTPSGEIDLIAARGRRLAFVEVKRRGTLEEAQASIGPRQQARIRNGALVWIGRHPSFQEHDVGFDAIFIVPRRWPLHLENCI